jgi:hypothetical protein
VLLGQGNVLWLVLVFIVLNFRFARPFVIQGGSAFVIEHIVNVILNGMLTTQQRQLCIVSITVN